jgi:hypothetical protein
MIDDWILPVKVSALVERGIWEKYCKIENINENSISEWLLSMDEYVRVPFYLLQDYGNKKPTQRTNKSIL